MKEIAKTFDNKRLKTIPSPKNFSEKLSKP